MGTAWPFAAGFGLLILLGWVITKIVKDALRG